MVVAFLDIEKAFDNDWSNRWFEYDVMQNMVMQVGSICPNFWPSLKDYT